jgi:hypothetical protein
MPTAGEHWNAADTLFKPDPRNPYCVAAIPGRSAIQGAKLWTWQRDLPAGPHRRFSRRRLGETEAFLEARAAAKEKDGLGRTVAIHLKEIVVGIS